MERGVAKWLDAAGTLHPARDDAAWKLAVQIGLSARFNVDVPWTRTNRQCWASQGGTPRAKGCSPLCSPLKGDRLSFASLRALTGVANVLPHRCPPLTRVRRPADTLLQANL
jgi:hypothetical protein